MGEKKIFTAHDSITCFACGKPIEAGSEFTYVPFGGRGATVAVHPGCARCEAK